MRFASSIFSTLNLRLTEHLGVMYRGYLDKARSIILLRWRDVTNGITSWTDWEIEPIPVPFLDAREKWLEVDYNGQIHKAQYKWGTLDDGQVQDGARGIAYPLRVYYQGNTTTQGVDIRVRGRVILPHQVTYLWPDRVPHGDMNNFVGELIIDDPVFSTVNNKVELDPNNPVWEAVSELLQDKEYAPTETIRTISRNEAEIRKRLQEKLRNFVSGSETQQEVPTWEAVGVLIDIIHTMPNKDENIYELKAGTAKPIDVYQLVMYWDARVEAGVRPKLGCLVAKEGSERVNNLIKYWNQRKDKGGERYNIEFKKIENLLP